MPTLLSFAVPITVALCLYAASVKLSARLLRYKVRWLTSFAFAVIIWLIAVFARLLDLGQPLTIAVGSMTSLCSSRFCSWVAGFSAPAAPTRAVSRLVSVEHLVFQVSRLGLCSLLAVSFFCWLMSSFVYSPPRPNQSLAPTAGRRDEINAASI